MAQGFGAGVPQIVTPMAFDQFDNAERLSRLNVGRSFRPNAYKAAAVARALVELTTNPRVAAACNRAAALVRSDRPLDVACDEIEQLWNRQQRPSGS